MSRELEEGETMPAPAEAMPVVDDSHRAGRVEIAISTLLRTGVICSITIILFGMILGYARHRAEVNDSAQLSSLLSRDGDFPHSLREVARGVLNLQSQAIIALGLLVLIITPVMRVAMSIIVFALQRDRVFVVITCIVLGLLITSFLLGHASG